MLTEVILKAYKCKCIEDGYFDNDRNKECHLVRENADGTISVREKYDCRCRLDGTGYNIEHISGPDILIECYLGYEYFVSYILVPIVNKQEYSDEEMYKLAKYQGRDWFLSLIAKNDKHMS